MRIWIAAFVISSFLWAMPVERKVHNREVRIDVVEVEVIVDDGAPF